MPEKITTSAQYYISVQTSNLLTDQSSQCSFPTTMIIYKYKFKVSQIILVGK